MNKKLASALAIGVLIVVIAWMAGLFEPRIDPTLATETQPTFAAADLYEVQPVEVLVHESIPASTVARDDTIVASRILARVERIFVRPGDFVKRGQSLVELQGDDLVARVNQARDNIDGIAAQFEDARLRLERMTELAAEKLAAQADLDGARANYDNLAAQLARARASLREAEAIAGYSRIAAPIDGRIVERLAEPGDTVSPAAPLLTLYDPATIRVEARIRESVALSLAIGQEFEIELDALGQRVTGRIEEIVPAAHIASRSFLVKASISYVPGLMPGMFARFSIPVTTSTEWLIPKHYLTEVGGLNLVYVETEGHPERRFVRLGRHYEDGRVAITAGLSPGTRIINPAAMN
ncbi:MAG: efflux RND transporter periplasmic adaptor subunit [Proteobacteria bacterium]|nr:efflux RND transporter periplasmic adaptor subunit [Pseudomonadota bacterium]MDA1299207.1 efflux RND transporter periplasmic adaptor subunit [Pseudomonadota bacterium]